ncbi:Scr1 family TA system antitoxin-like transcriptional regulator [Streptomyces anulatus]
MTLWTPVARVVGACLRDAREGLMMLPEQPAELLGITPDALLAMEEGRYEISAGVLAELTGLYRCGDEEPGLRRLLAQRPEWNGITRDREPGHARRFAACAASAGRVRWLSHESLPAPLQTPQYAQAVAEPDTFRPGAARPPAGNTVYVLDTDVLHRGSGTARVMTAQLDHLLDLIEQGTDIRVLPEDRPPLPQLADHIVDLALPAGRVLACPDTKGVSYCSTLRFAAHIDAALGNTDQHSSREDLHRAAASGHARAGISTPHHAELRRHSVPQPARRNTAPTGAELTGSAASGPAWQHTNTPQIQGDS